MRGIFFPNFPKLAQKLLCGKFSPTNFLQQVVGSHQLSRIGKYEVFLEVKNFVLLEKKVSQSFIFFYSVRLIDHSIENKGVETCVPEFSGILPNF